MKRFSFFLAIIINVSFLCGCASIPDMTPEHEEAVSEYAAALMLKYDSANHSRLVDVSNIVDEYNSKKFAYETAEKEYYEEQQKLKDEQEKEEEQRREENAEQEGSGSEGGTESNDGTGGATVIDKEEQYDNSTSLEDYIGLSGFEVTYKDYLVTDFYGSEEAFCITPNKKDDKLLVIEYEVKNNTGGSANFNMVSRDVSFAVSINDGKFRTIEPGMYEMSFGQAYDTFSANESKTYILSIDISGDTIVDSLNIKVTASEKNPIVRQLK